MGWTTINTMISDSLAMRGWGKHNGPIYRPLVRPASMNGVSKPSVLQQMRIPGEPDRVTIFMAAARQLVAAGAACADGQGLTVPLHWLPSKALPGCDH